MTELRRDRAGQDRRHPDSLVAQVEHGGLREPEQAELRRVVGGASCEGVDRGERADVHDETAAVLLQERNGEVSGVVRAEEVRFDDGPESLGVQLFDRLELSDPRVVDENVETSERRAHEIDQRLLIRLAPGVGRGARELRRRNQFFEARNRGVDALGVARGDRDRETVGAQPVRHRETDSAASSGDQRDAALDSHALMLSDPSATVSR